MEKMRNESYNMSKSRSQQLIAEKDDISLCMERSGYVDCVHGRTIIVESYAVCQHRKC